MKKCTARYFVFLLLLVVVVVVSHVVLPSAAAASASAAAGTTKKPRSSSSSSRNQKRQTNRKNLQDLEYIVYPRRTEEEAAVLEWGHSAIISALDASVAHFGPQTTQAALLEVEAQPILANPISGVFTDDDDDDDEEENDEIADYDDEEDEKDVVVDEEESSTATTTTDEKKSLENDNNNNNKKIRPLRNSDEVHGNLVVMTNTGNLTGVEMALIAQESGAVALVVVNVDEDHPESISRLPATAGADEIDIPVVMISLNSANVLTTATIEPDMKKSDVVNNGMPMRVRLYSGGDRPFFEDVDTLVPAIYLIHNLLTAEECDSLIRQAKSKVSRITKDDTLQLTHNHDNYVNVDRVMLWQGMLQSAARKQIEERIEQVTGFPSNHYSDFIVDRLREGSYWKPHYDTFPGGGGGDDEDETADTVVVPMASMTIFLSEEQAGGEIVFPSAEAGDQAVKIKPTRGMAVVHHNVDENNRFDENSLHAMLPLLFSSSSLSSSLSSTSGGGSDGSAVYVARKYIFSTPISNAKRVAVPIFAAPFGGKLPYWPFVSLYDALVDKFGYTDGEAYFEKLCVIVPAVMAVFLAQFLVDQVQRRMKKKNPSSTTITATATVVVPNKKKKRE